MRIYFLYLLVTTSLFLAGSLSLIEKAYTEEDVTLEWDAPSINTNGTTITQSEGLGFELRWGSESGNLTNSQDVGNVTAYTLKKFSGGTYYFSVVAYNSSGAKSILADELKIIVAGAGTDENDTDEDGKLDHDDLNNLPIAMLDFDTPPDRISDIGHIIPNTAKKRGELETSSFNYEIYLSGHVGIEKFSPATSEEILVPADYNGDGTSELAAVTEEGGKLIWQSHDMLTKKQTFKAKFGKSSDSILSGCFFGADRAIPAVFGNGILKIKNSGKKRIAPIILSDFSEIIDISCSRDKIFVLGKIKAGIKAAKDINDNIKNTSSGTFLVGIDLNGKRTYERKVLNKKAKLLIADVNNDGLADPGYYFKAGKNNKLNFFTGEEKTPVSFNVPVFTSITTGIFPSESGAALPGAVFFGKGGILQSLIFSEGKIKTLEIGINGSTLLKAVNFIPAKVN